MQEPHCVLSTVHVWISHATSVSSSFRLLLPFSELTLTINLVFFICGLRFLLVDRGICVPSVPGIPVFHNRHDAPVTIWQH